MSPTPEQGRDFRADAWDRALGVESRSPGQNVWAQKKVEEHNYRLQGNAFYQRKFSDGKPIPPSATHPAFRTPSGTEVPIPPMPPSAMRDSSVTTMSVFVQAGQEAQSPQLNLHTTPNQTPQPTQRGFIEEHNEQQQHARSGSKDDRTPVFRPTPKMHNGESGQVKQSSKKNQEVKFVDPQPQQHLPTKSPKKSLFGRFFGTAKTNTPPPPENLPPKAEQILGEKTPRRGKGLVRSPSKPKGLFSRRSSDADALISPRRSQAEVAEPPRSQSSMGNHNSYSSRGSLTKRTGSQAGSNAASLKQATPLITRTQSLKYMDSSIPPTPPSKDTPPDEKAIRNASNLETPIIPFDNNTPSRSTGFVSTDKNLSPTKLGSYGYRVGANLVTKPSMHSMRASVVPEEMDPAAFADAKSRVEGLGLEGFSMPYETRRQSQTPYSPSIYSPDWGRKSVATFPERIEERKEEEESPSMRMIGGHFLRQESINTLDTNATSGTIHVGIDEKLRKESEGPRYPELVKDESIVDFMKFGPLTVTNPDETPRLHVTEDDTPRLDGGLDEGFRSTAHLFAAAHKHDYTESPMSHHSSAQVSPLHLHSAHLETLPATVYVPNATPSNKKKKKHQMQTPSSSIKHRKSQSLSAVDSVGSPAPKCASRDVLENRPLLPKEASPSWKTRQNAFNTDPRKPPSNINLSKSLTQLSLSSRDQSNPWPKIPEINHPEDSGVEFTEPDTANDRPTKKKKRISTLHAHEYYRHSPEPGDGSPPKRNSEASTIIHTPNLPVQMTHARNAEGVHTSSGLGMDLGVPQIAGSAEEKEPTMADLMAMIQQQQSTIQQMMLKMQRMGDK